MRKVLHFQLTIIADQKIVTARDLCLNDGKLTFHTDHIKCAVVCRLQKIFCSLQASSAFAGYHEKYMHEWHVRGDASAGGRGEKGELATISHKSSFPLRKPQDSVKCELSPQVCCKLGK